MDLDIVIAGEINLDLILCGLPAEMPVERELLADNFVMTLGSSSAILAHNIAILGTRVGFVSMVGADPLGALALDYLRRANVDLSHTVRSGTKNTGVTVLLPHGEHRHILTYPGTMVDLRRSDLNDTYLQSARHFHVSSLFLQKGLQRDLPKLFRELRGAGVSLSLDTNDDPEDRWQSGLDELLGLVDIFLPNEDEAVRMTSARNVQEAADILARRVPVVAIKCGRRGAIVCARGHSALVAGERLTPVDTIGAGDSFNAGFLHAFLKGKAPLECASLGNKVAALSTQRAGGIAALLDHELRQTCLLSSAE